jgi:hypothetical protein
MRQVNIRLLTAALICLSRLPALSAEDLLLLDAVRLRSAPFTPNMVGFYAMNTEGCGHLDIDWFKYEYDGPKCM